MGKGHNAYLLAFSEIVKSNEIKDNDETYHFLSIYYTPGTIRSMLYYKALSKIIPIMQIGIQAQRGHPDVTHC